MTGNNRSEVSLDTGPISGRTKARCTRQASYAFFERMRLISWRHVLFWCVWCGLHSNRNLFLYWRIRLTAL